MLKKERKISKKRIRKEDIVSVADKTEIISIRQKLKDSKDKKIVTGITKRWATNTLLITALVLLVLVASCILFIVEYYRNYVTNYLSGYANETVTTYFTPYVDANDDIFEQKAKEYVDSFSDKSRVEVQVVNRHGKVSVSSSSSK